MPFWLGELLAGAGEVGSSVKQRAEVSSVGGLHLEHPGSECILVDRLGRVSNGAVNFGNGAGNRCVHIGSSLDRLNNDGFLMGGQGLADLRQVDENEITEQVLRMIGDADGDRAIGFSADPLVALGVLEIGWAFMVTPKNWIDAGYEK